MDLKNQEIVEATLETDAVACFSYCKRLNCLIIGNMNVKILNA